MSTPAVSDVQTLFNGKAHAWQYKYGPGGKLDSRLARFTARLSALCPPPARILDLGCGTGEISAAIGQGGYQVTACDIAERMLEVARNNWAGIPVEWLSLRSGWTVLPFKGLRFDAIVSSSVFEYLLDVEGVARELARVLRPGGVLIFSVPNPCNRIRKFEERLRSAFFSRTLNPMFLRVRPVKSYLTYLRVSRNRFGAAQWESILSNAGFQPVDKKEFSETRWLEGSDFPLVLLTAKKVVTSRPYPFCSAVFH